jgi:hypothetical protein
MAGSWKKVWEVRSYPEAVQRMLRTLPAVFDGAGERGMLGWVGRTFSHQRKDMRPKAPRLTAERPERLVFQHDLVTPFTYTVELAAVEDRTRVTLEVRTTELVKDTTPADQVTLLCYALSRALEPQAR